MYTWIIPATHYPGSLTAGGSPRVDMTSSFSHTPLELKECLSRNREMLSIADGSVDIMKRRCLSHIVRLEMFWYSE